MAMSVLLEFKNTWKWKKKQWGPHKRLNKVFSEKLAIAVCSNKVSQNKEVRKVKFCVAGIFLEASNVVNLSNWLWFLLQYKLNKRIVTGVIF